MRIEPIVPDRGPSSPAGESNDAARQFERLVDAAGQALATADGAEAAFARGHGGLQQMVVSRAQADIALAVAASGAQRAAQALNTLLGMQI
jgi:flagellar hook-basal body complex protein FliE